MALKKVNPPKWPASILEWYCGVVLAEDLLGDIDELFYRNIKKMPAWKAGWKYWMQVIVLLFSYAVKSRKRNHSIPPDSTFSLAMLHNYSKIALRSMGREKTFSIINIICLSTGMSVGLLALAAFVDMKEVDEFHTKKDRIYRIVTNVDDGNTKNTYASSSAPLAQTVLQDGNGIEVMVQFNKNFQPTILKGKNEVPLSGYYADREFFNVFSFSLLVGDEKTALTKPFSIILTESTAKIIFGDANALGKLVEVKGLGEFEVTGVLKDFHRSHFLFEALASFSTITALENTGVLDETGLNDWGPVTDYYTYIMFQEGSEPDNLNFLLDKLSTEYNQNEEHHSKIKLHLQNLSDIPGTDYYNEIGLVWGYLAMSIFFGLALLVLLPACFNYTNISIGRALKRAKEIGLRKVSGGQSKNIFAQMISETVILSLISLLGAVLIYIAVREEFKDMIVGGSRSFDLEITPLTMVTFVVFAIGTGIFAGLFPASYFSKLNPIETLRNSSSSGKLSKVNVRKGLIVFQFTISLGFILGVAIIIKQYQYALNFNYGFQKENILEVPLNGTDPDVLKTEFERLSEVSSVAMSSSIPGSWQSSSAWVKEIDKQDSLQVYQMFIDENYLSCLELTLLAGENFSKQNMGPEKFIIVNEEFLKRFGIQDNREALNREFIVDGNTLRIQGIVKDFNHMPLNEKISGFFFRYDPEKSKYAHVKIASNDITATLKNIESVWEEIQPNTPFESYFLDDHLEDTLISFHSMMKIFGFLGGMAIIISSLGLLAVVVSSSQSRMKEMGVRKVLGASVLNLTLSLSKGFLKLIGIAILIATPLTYFFFDSLMLRVHHYRTSIGFLEIASGILFLFLLVLLTVGIQTLKVAHVNPVETLKNE